MKLGWHFEKIGEMGGAHDGAFRNPLAGSGLLREHKLAREAIQNSVDARHPNEIVRVRFGLETLGADQLREIGQHLQLLDPSGPVERSWDVPDFGVNQADFFDAQVDSEGKSNSILFVEDYGTHGLGGPSTATRTSEMDSRYYRLILGFGVSDESEESRGGSFGFGKSVYWQSSEVNTVVFYSVFAPNEETEFAHARLIVSGLYSSHDYGGATYTGRAWLGVPQSPTYCGPLVDQAAHEMAERLGFQKRSQGELGTSMMILGCDLDIRKIREGIQNHWWPRMVDGDLDVELVDNGAPVSPPSPRKTKALAPYIQAYEKAQARTELNDESITVTEFRRSHGRKVGWCAIVPADRDEFPPEEDRPHSLKPMYPDINEVALIRSPRMVVAYHELRSGPDVVGAYVADDEIDPVLKLAEPPDHTRWAEDGGRLVTREDKTLVRGMDNRINRVVEELRKHLRGEVNEEPGSPKQLEQLMGRLFGARRGGDEPPPPPPIDSKVTISTDTQVENDTGMARIRGRAVVKCKEAYDHTEFDCKVTIRVDVLGQDTRTVDEALGVRVYDPNTGLASGNPAQWVRMGRGRVATFEFESDLYDDYLLCQVVVDTEEG